MMLAHGDVNCGLSELVKLFANRKKEPEVASAVAAAVAVAVAVEAAAVAVAVVVGGR